MADWEQRISLRLNALRSKHQEYLISSHDNNQTDKIQYFQTKRERLATASVIHLLTED